MVEIGQCADPTKGVPGKEITCNRGLRQGDPLSPLMFVLDVKSINKMFERTRAADWTKGLPGCNTVSITKLQYADDTLLFENYDLREAIVMKSILVYFEAWSGLQINYHKSSMINLGKRNINLMLIQSIFGYKEVS